MFLQQDTYICFSWFSDYGRKTLKCIQQVSGGGFTLLNKWSSYDLISYE